MSQLPHARSFRDLIVYQKAVALECDIFQRSKNFPPEERYSLTDQIRRAVRSIGSQIAEAWAKRIYPAHFVTKLSDSDAEQMETQHWVGSAVRSGYWMEQDADALITRLEEVGRMLGSMARSAESFCQRDPRVLRESTAEYFVSTGH